MASRRWWAVSFGVRPSFTLLALARAAFARARGSTRARIRPGRLERPTSSGFAAWWCRPRQLRTTDRIDDGENCDANASGDQAALDSCYAAAKPIAFQAKDLSSILRACFKLAPAPDYSSLNGPHFSSVAKRLSKSTVAPATKTNVGGSLRVYWLMITDLRSFA